MSFCGDSIRVVHPLFQEEDDGSIPISPLQFEISEIPKQQACELNAMWHSVLPEIPVFHVQHAYAAIFKNTVYAVALWGRPVARTICDKGWLELRRMAIAPDAPKNTASRMLSVMARLLKKGRSDIVKFISYQDTEHHRGTIYKAAGWSPVDMSSSPINWGGAAQRKVASRKRNPIIATAPKVRWELDVVGQKDCCARLLPAQNC